ncbi:uncharacterized protein LOC133779594 [Humulus lupulus]|uniref:uncharacterized protein LOC133779594 n=1 Tax=Humulus lupulus TaxID=3486 RepID=UPI002B4028D1|nr:uncharacterized protein LOC133779594 [Humulus lupulus]
MNENLLGRFTEEDVISAVRGMNPIKAPGIDGLPALFFQKFWSSIRGDVVSVCLKVLNDNIPLHKLNETLITLIPKVPKAKKVEKYRPISLCNVAYKIVSKCLVDRMKSSLTVAVSNSQSAFVMGRMIHDSAIIGYEGLHCMRKDRFGNGKKLALKLYMSKAYDRIEWRFVERLMLKMGYHEDWVKKILGCITSVSFSFLLNGEVRGNVSPGRGLRQGDPLSPFIFFLCAEALSCLILGAEQSNLLEGLCFGRRGVRVSHLFFADDSIMFLNVNVDECRALKYILRCYTTASGQMINFSKSEVCFGSKVDEGTKKEIAEILEVQITNDFERYLGLPGLVGRSKKETFKYIKALFIALLPSSGGALLRKEGEFIGANGKCCVKESSEEAKLGAAPSFIWRSLLWGRQIIEAGARWRIGSGEEVRIVEDKWLLRPVQFTFMEQPELPPGLKVIDLRGAEGEWDENFVRSIFNKEDASSILGIIPGPLDSRDKRIWNYNQNGEYSVRSGYQVEIREREMVEGSDMRETERWRKKVWSLSVPPKIKQFLWKLSNKWLPTNSVLFCRKLRKDYDCCRCGENSQREDWKSRNNGLLKRWNPEATAMVDWAANYHNKFAQSRGANSHKSTSIHEAWTSPAVNELMINVDAARNKVQGCCSSGVVIRDCAGRVIVSKSTFINYSSLAVGMLNRPPEESGDLDLLVAAIKREAEDLRILSVRYGPRSSNTIAHLTAKFAIRYQASGFWEGGVPPMASLALAEDMACLGGRL